MTKREVQAPIIVELCDPAPVHPPQEIRELTARESVFAQWFAESRNLVTAYRAAYDVNPNATHRILWYQAHQIMIKPQVAKRIEEIQDRLASAGVVRAIQILQDLADIVNTDPNEIIKITKHNCRHCHGEGYRYQWRDPAEFASRLDAYGAQQARLASGAKLDKGEAVIARPEASGGFGFDPHGEPNMICPHCLGVGTERVTISDTTKLSPAARKLIKNIKQDRYGVTTVELYDKNQSRDMILKVLGAYKNDGKGLSITGAAPLDGISQADQNDPRATADAYIRMLSAPAS